MQSNKINLPVSIVVSRLPLNGGEVESVLNAALTQLLTPLPTGGLISTCRLDIKGKIASHFFVGKTDTNFFFVIGSPSQLHSFREDLTQHLIMEDVSFGVLETQYLNFYSDLSSILAINTTEYIGYFAPFYLTLSKEPMGKLARPSDLDFINLWTGANFFEEVGEVGENIVQSRLYDHTVNLSKGCFLGQAVVSKLIQGRGVRFYPAMIEDNLGQISIKKLSREDRIPGKYLSEFQGKVRLYPDIDYAQIFHDIAFQFYLNSHYGPARNWFHFSLAFRPDYLSSLEGLGVLELNAGNYSYALELFQKIEIKNPQHPLLNTNLSRLYALLGDKEQAEKYLFQNTSIARKKNDQEADGKIDLYLKVLELDPFDSFALTELTSFYLNRDPLIAKKYLERLLALESTPPITYLYAAELAPSDARIDYLQLGMEAAASKGQFALVKKFKQALELGRF